MEQSTPSQFRNACKIIERELEDEVDCLAFSKAVTKEEVGRRLLRFEADEVVKIRVTDIRFAVPELVSRQ